MPAAPPHILLVEDSLPLARTYEEYLKSDGHHVTVATLGATALDLLKQQDFAAAVFDVQLPDMTGIDILRWVHREKPGLPVLVVTAHGSVNVAVAAMREGAFDFIVKPFSATRLQVTVKNALEQFTLKQEVRQLRRVLDQDSYYDFIGQSQVMQAVYRTIDAVAASKASVFITGESGTGKELAAQAIHKASPRRNQPFIALNCGAIPHELLESHIFGHIKGSFTGAISDQIGAGKAADGGTLFLDEICEMPLELQVKMLRFIQTGAVQQVGSTKTEKVDVRLVAATNRDPLAAVKSGKFREDLYYRLHVVPLDMPPLREREDDILRLAHHFLHKSSGEEGKTFNDFSAEVAAEFRRYNWPGNVRQLENLIRNIVVLHDSAEVTLAMLPDLLKAETPAPPPTHAVTATAAPATILPLWQVEKNAIMAALAANNQDVPRAAALLEVSPSTLYRKLQSWKKN
ncbi:MAG: sigma-54 dependent transcriptional regulator [Alphaproteobacteria bacterium]